MNRIFEIIYAEWNELTSKPATEQAHCTAADPVPNSSFLFNHRLTLDQFLNYYFLQALPRVQCGQ